MKKNPLLDKEFLKALDNYGHREVFAKVIALNLNEEPIKEITGRVTQGSITIDGTSAIRRSCSFTMMVDHGDQLLKDYVWTLKTKFRLFVGLKNFINPEYPEIIWFKQGLFLTTSFSPNYSSTGTSISIQGKDKMCLLNGDIGGSLTACSYDFAHVDAEVPTDDGKIRIEKQDVLLKDIIFEAVRTFAQEPVQNILISDLDDLGLEFLRYNGTKPFYILIDAESGDAINYTISEEKQLGSSPNKSDINITWGDKGSFTYDTRISLNLEGKNDPTILYDGNTPVTVIKCQAGDILGYRTTNLTYPGDLIGKAGDSVEAAVLKKIVEQFGDFEYFYDVDGRFHFQRKKSYLDVKWNNMVRQEEDYIPVAMSASNYKKNCYYVKDSSSTYILADFDTYKATYDNTNTPIKYYQRVENENYFEVSAAASPIVYSFLDSKLVTSFSNSPKLNNVRNDFSIWGERTSVNGGKIPIVLRYAIDKKPKKYTTFAGKTYVAEGSGETGGTFVDWRELIYQMALDYRHNSGKENFSYLVEKNNGDLYIGGRTGYEQYYTDMEGFWRQIYCPDRNDTKYDEKVFDGKVGWAKTVLTSPELINFWFDFINVDGELGQFSVKAIGDRVKAKSDTKIKAVYFKDTPTIIFVDENISPEDYARQKEKKPGYTLMKLPNDLYGLFTTSSPGTSAMSELNELLYKHTNFEDSITLNCIPIYYLEPNNKILVRDENTGIDGEYMINRITLPLNHNGTMSISASKVIDRLI